MSKSPNANSGPLPAPAIDWRVGRGVSLLHDPKGFLRTYAGQLGITAAFIVVWLLFVVLAPDTFLAARIYAAFAQSIPLFGIIAMPLTLVIVAGEIDLSFGSTMALSMVGFVLVWEHTNENVWLALLMALVIGAAAGVFNGIVIVYARVPALVATIGTLYLFRGLSMVIMGGRNVHLGAIGNSLVYRISVGKHSFLRNIPAQFFWLLGIAIIMWFLLNRHRFGAAVYVIGDNAETAALQGIKTNRVRLTLFVLVGLAAAFAGVISSLNIRSFFPSVGEEQLLPALAAVFVGGTSVFGGRGTIWGTFLGAFLVGTIRAGIVAVGLTGFATDFIYGSVIVVSVTIHALLQRRFG